jgi:hypothetical protein
MKFYGSSNYKALKNAKHGTYHYLRKYKKNATAINKLRLETMLRLEPMDVSKNDEDYEKNVANDNDDDYYDDDADDDDDNAKPDEDNGVHEYVDDDDHNHVVDNTDSDNGVHQDNDNDGGNGEVDNIIPPNLSNEDNNDDNIPTLHAQLLNSGLLSYLQSTLEYVDHRAKTIISRFHNLISFLKIDKYYDTSIQALIKLQHGRLEQYVQHLKKKRFQPSSIEDNLDDISLVLHWFVLFSPANKNSCSFPDLQLVKYKIEVLKNALSRTSRNSKRRKTLDSLVEQRKLPEGKDNKERLVKLQHCIVDTLEWAFNEDRPITDKRYNKLIGLVVASFYCYAPQGRVQGISDIRLDQVNPTYIMHHHKLHTSCITISITKHHHHAIMYHHHCTIVNMCRLKHYSMKDM